MSTAILLAGGLGARLRPYTAILPKPLMPVGDLPILEVIIKQLALHGIREHVLAVNYQAELMRAYFGNGDRFGVDIRYSLETRALGTMGPLRLIPSLPEHFIIMNGDVLCDLDFAGFLDRHVRADHLFTIAAVEREQSIDYGVVHCDDDSRLVGFCEKPRSKYLVSMGVYCASRRILEWIPNEQPFGFDELMLKLLAAGESVNIERHGGYWLDIGRPDDYACAVEDWPRMRKSLGF
jgi:NDP-sugar pyrophosphorylase family protein